MTKPDKSYSIEKDFPAFDRVYTFKVEELSSSYYSNSTPGYPGKIQENSMQIHNEFRKWGPIALESSDGDIYGYFLPDNAPVPPYGYYDQALEFKLLNRLQSRIQQGQVDLLTAAAERKDSIQMIGSRVNQMTDLLVSHKKNMSKLEKALKKAQSPKKIKRLVNLISSLRLEFSFGWAPLASDLYTLGNEIMPPIFYADVSATVIGSQHEPTYSFGYTGGYKGTVKLTGKIGLQMSNPFTSSAAQLGLTNPAATAWELVPWSFAVDWILPIGDYLRQASMLDGLDVRFSSLTVAQSGQGSIEYAYNSSTAWSSVNLTHYRRGPLPSPRLPRFMDSPFGSLTRTFNQLALLGQMIGKDRKK